jgi:hypothetical protein
MYKYLGVTMKTKTLTLLASIILQSISVSSIANEPLSFPKPMYTDGACSEVYFKKGKRVNRVMGITLGAATAVSSIAMPLAPIFFLGGIAIAGETGYSYIEERDKPEKKSKEPRIRYPIAKQYFDITNTIELNKILNKNPNSDLNDYIKLYIESVVLSANSIDQYKSCKRDSRLAGIAKDERQAIEKDITSFLMMLEEEDELNESKRSDLNAAKQNYAKCLLNIQSEDKETYPVADMLLFRSELEQTSLLTWKMKSVIRLYKYAYKKAKHNGQDLDIETYFLKINMLSDEGKICESSKRPYNRRKLIKEILALVK